MIELSGAEILFAVIFIIIILSRLSALEKRVATISRIDGKLDALLKHAGIEFDPYENLPDEVIQALQRGKKITAIKRYRKETGAGLKEAKETIDVAAKRGTPGP